MGERKATWSVTRKGMRKMISLGQEAFAIIDRQKLTVDSSIQHFLQNSIFVKCRSI